MECDVCKEKLDESFRIIQIFITEKKDLKNIHFANCEKQLFVLI